MEKDMMATMNASWKVEPMYFGVKTDTGGGLRVGEGEERGRESGEGDQGE